MRACPHAARSAGTPRSRWPSRSRPPHLTERGPASCSAAPDGCAAEPEGGPAAFDAWVRDGMVWWVQVRTASGAVGWAEGRKHFRDDGGC
ncbi:MAG TPA: hypothetical protein VLS93_05700 [Anaeromyxobacteraceae bacterium]|nr:hypothetical protein [Anaeromyxobacteraceae bacterium]